MTMPESEYIEHECTMQCAPNCTTQGASYIRADIAEEIARALEYEQERGRLSVSSATILARYRALTLDTHASSV